MKSIGTVLSELRTAAGLRQQELSEQFRLHNNPVSSGAISKWEKDNTLPNAAQFLTLCEIYGAYPVIRAFLPDDRSFPISELNEEGCRKVLEYIGLLRDSGHFNRPEPTKPAVSRSLPLFDLPASAGTGELLLGDSSGEVTFSEPIPAEADFCLRLNGDSMEPRFHDGQLVFVHSCSVLNDGELGIFGYDGRAYCKKLSVNSSGIRLLSFNEKYPPIPVSPSLGFTVFGRLVE